MAAGFYSTILFRPLPALEYEAVALGVVVGLMDEPHPVEVRTTMNLDRAVRVFGIENVDRVRVFNQLETFREHLKKMITPAQVEALANRGGMGLLVDNPRPMVIDADLGLAREADVLFDEMLRKHLAWNAGPVTRLEALTLMLAWATPARFIPDELDAHEQGGFPFDHYGEEVTEKLRMFHDRLVKHAGMPALWRTKYRQAVDLLLGEIEKELDARGVPKLSEPKRGGLKK
jgi:hypothetical protein